MKDLILALLAWIAAETNLAVPAPPPVEFVSEARLLQLAGGNAEVRAMYVRDERVVYLRDDWSPGDLRSRATLMHELVHHVQFVNAVPARCPAEREQLAYRLTVKWLSEQGAADPYAVLNTDEFTILFLSVCME